MKIHIVRLLNNYFLNLDESDTTKNDSQILENKDSLSIEKTNLKDERSTKKMKSKLGKLRFRRRKQKNIIKFLKPMFSKFTEDQMTKLTESHDYFAIMREKVTLAAAVVKKLTAVDDIHYCHLVFLGARPKRRGYGRRMINMLIKKYKKIIVWSEKKIINVYKKSKFTEAKSLIYPLASQVKFYNNSLFMKFGFTEEEISKIKKWGTVISDEIREKAKKNK
jgi:hypothetical protein